jgi:hypothetical protein
MNFRVVEPDGNFDYDLVFGLVIQDYSHWFCLRFGPTLLKIHWFGPGLIQFWGYIRVVSTYIEYVSML